MIIRGGTWKKDGMILILIGWNVYVGYVNPMRSLITFLACKGEWSSLFQSYSVAYPFLNLQGSF